MSLTAGAPRAPYALDETSFPLPALAALSGRAPLGGPREIAMACFMVARLVLDAAIRRGSTGLEPAGLSTEQRKARAAATRQWLASTAVPTGVRTALARLADATVSDDRGALRSAIDSVTAVTANHLDPGARLELARLAQAIAE